MYMVNIQSSILRIEFQAGRFMNTEHPKINSHEAFDGLMLGDASLVLGGKRAYFTISLSDSRDYKNRKQITTVEFMIFLSYLKTLFIDLDTNISDNFPKIYPN